MDHFVTCFVFKIWGCNSLYSSIRCFYIFVVIYPIIYTTGCFKIYFIQDEPICFTRTSNGDEKIITINEQENSLLASLNREKNLPKYFRINSAMAA